MSGSKDEIENQIPHWMGRTRILLGDEGVTTLMKSNVLVAGLGGVGAICAEMIVRAGVGKMTIVDADTVDPTNRNRQIPALYSTEGQLKTDVMADRLLAINPDLDLTVIPQYLKGDTTEGIIEAQKYDYACDCIDTLSSKVFYLVSCLNQNIPVVSSMGAGGKVDPTKLLVADVFDTFNCHLAQDVRKYLRRLSVTKGKIKAVFSSERILKESIRATPNDMKKKSYIGTISYVPAVFGCTVASVVIRDLAEI